MSFHNRITALIDAVVGRVHILVAVLRRSHGLGRAVSRNQVGGSADVAGTAHTSADSGSVVITAPSACEIRLTTLEHEQSADRVPEQISHLRAERQGAGELLPKVRLRIQELAGIVAEVTRLLDAHAADLGYGARAQLRDDVLLLDDELAALKAWLVAPLDWDADYGRLLAGEIPPLEDRADGDEAN